MHQDIKNTLIWMVGATLILGIAIWQAQVAVTQDRLASEITLPPPVKTRSADRAPTETVVLDPISNYQSRKEKGLTVQEIGWILDDFKTAGLDLGIRAATREEYLLERLAQDRWYRDALVEGWSLSKEQAAEVTRKLSELSDLAKANFIEALNAGPRPFQVDGQWFNVTGTEPIYQLVDFARRFAVEDSPTLPWRLCKLPQGEFPDLEELKTNFPKLLLPRPKSLVDAERNFPNGLEFVRGYHPAQLKLELLFSPHRAKDLEKLVNDQNP